MAPRLFPDNHFPDFYNLGASSRFLKSSPNFTRVASCLQNRLRRPINGARIESHDLAFCHRTSDNEDTEAGVLDPARAEAEFESPLPENSASVLVAATLEFSLPFRRMPEHPDVVG